MGGAGLAREMWDAGERVALIARAVGTTHAAIVGYAHRNGWPPHPKQPVGAEWRAQRKAAIPPQPAAIPPQPAAIPPQPPRIRPRIPPAKPRDTRSRLESCHPAPLAVPTARFRGCQWPTTDARPWRFCDQPVAGPGGVWCAEHRAVAYYRARALPEVAA
jgi:hypothetical protein